MTELYPQLEKAPFEQFNMSHGVVIKVYSNEHYVELFQIAGDNVQRLQMKHDRYQEFKQTIESLVDNTK